jgi:hypothetical protein
MSEDKETGFKITDRRKFNADGSPRDAAPVENTPTQDAPPPARARLAVEEAAEAIAEIAEEAAANNVVSFPGDAAKKREAAETAAAPSPAPAKEPATDAPDDARAAQAKAAASAAEQAYNQSAGTRPAGVPEASFLVLVDMFAGEAAMNLGMAQTPDGNRLPVDLEAARHWIDMLGMLEQKTDGNLTDEEAGVMENVLAYLRMQFVALSRRQ